MNEFCFKYISIRLVLKHPRIITLTTLALAIITSSSAYAFDYFEHRYLGNKAYTQALRACRDAELRDNLQRVMKEKAGFGRKPSGQSMAEQLLNELPIQFGDLSALAGDLTKDPEDLTRVINDIKDIKDDLRKKRAAALVIDTRRQWFNTCKWLYRQAGKASNQIGDWRDWEDCHERIAGNGNLYAEPNHLLGSSGYNPSRVELAENENIPNYIALASENINHFARYSWKTYSEYHAAAIVLAGCYATYPDISPNSKSICANKSPDDLLLASMINESFAQHFLHDSFASGHIATKYSDCILFICDPIKIRMLQTHDVLNELGIEVVMPNPPGFIWKPDNKIINVLRTGWTLYGDDHLFIPEANFQRAVIIQTATQSLIEVIDRASTKEKGNFDTSCKMCTTEIFPIPQDNKYLSLQSKETLDNKDLTADKYPVGDLTKFEWFDFSGSRSLDARVPGLPLEGWKISLGYVNDFKSYQESGGIFEWQKRDYGFQIKLDYIRSTGPKVPNVCGFEYVQIPSYRTSYLFNFGYLLPREQGVFNWGLLWKIGVRTEDNFTKYNPSPNRINSLEASLLTLEILYAIYPPFTLYLQVNPATLLYSDGHQTSESIINGKMSTALGIKLDLSGI
jgi:hypothetical protein